MGKNIYGLSMQEVEEKRRYRDPGKRKLNFWYSSRRIRILFFQKNRYLKRYGDSIMCRMRQRYRCISTG